MQLRSLSDLAEYKDREPDSYARVFELATPGLTHLRQGFGYNFWELSQKIPTETYIRSQFYGFWGEDALPRAMQLLFGYLNEAVYELQLLSTHPTEWPAQTLADQVKIEMLVRGGFVRQFDEGLIPIENLVRFMKDYETTGRDYRRSGLTTQAHAAGEVVQITAGHAGQMRQNAFRLLIKEGQEAADTYLKGMRVKPHIRRKMIDELNEEIDDYRGENIGTVTSRFEREVGRVLGEKGIFYRRQIPYSKVTGTERQYRMDYLVGDNVIEVVDVEDDFIHTLAYWKRLEEKQELAEQAGLGFIVIANDTDLQTSMQELLIHTEVPAELLTRMDFRERPMLERLVETVTQPQSLKRIIHFCDNVFMIPHLRRRIA
ncbi:hypothetical protein JW868_02665 [Candidatus Woesearchaeota archaeon]|nr:hypothetical protein [Candidatus Woesearchaeota archaeon]